MKKLMLESLNFYNERKVTFTKENSFLKLELYNENKNEGELILLPKKGNFKVGLIDISLLDTAKLFGMDFEKNSDKAKKLVHGFMQGDCITMEHKIIMTQEVDFALQHELQHVFDNLMEIDGGLEEREYRAYLAGLKYCENKEIHLMNIPFFIEKKVNELGKKIFDDEHKYNYLSLIRIMKEFSDFYEGETENRNEIIEKRCDLLLDKNYVKNTGMTYDRILNTMIKMYTQLE